MIIHQNVNSQKMGILSIQTILSGISVNVYGMNKCASVFK